VPNLDEFCALKRLRPRRHLDRPARRCCREIGLCAKSLRSQHVDHDRFRLRRPDIPVRPAISRDRLEREAVTDQCLDDVLQSRLIGADVRDNVAVLAYLRWDLPALECMQQDHLPADQGPPDRKLSEVEEQMPQLINR
jgi:hypothetical protein